MRCIKRPTGTATGGPSSVREGPRDVLRTLVIALTVAATPRAEKISQHARVGSWRDSHYFFNTAGQFQTHVSADDGSSLTRTRKRSPSIVL